MSMVMNESLLVEIHCNEEASMSRRRRRPPRGRRPMSIRLPNTTDEGLLAEADYRLMVGLTNALSNPPNYPTARSMSGLLRHDVVFINDTRRAFFAVHRNVTRRMIVGRYLLPKNLTKPESWALLRAVCKAIADGWPETLGWPAFMPFTGRDNPQDAADSTKLFFDGALAAERPSVVDDAEMGWALHWPRFSDLVKLARNYDGPSVIGIGGSDGP